MSQIESNGQSLLRGLLADLQTVSRSSARRDAIDEVLASTPRETHVRSLAEDEIVQRFERELIDGFIRADTAHQLLGLLREYLRLAIPL